MFLEALRPRPNLRHAEMNAIETFLKVNKACNRCFLIVIRVSNDGSVHDRSDHGFGLAVNIVNGGCSSLRQIIASVGQPYKKASDDNANRAQWYQVFTYAFGITP